MLQNVFVLKWFRYYGVEVSWNLLYGFPGESVEDYKDLIQETSDKPNYRIGYNYLIKDYKIKISLDNYFRLNSGKIENYYASLQLQLFLK